MQVHGLTDRGIAVVVAPEGQADAVLAQQAEVACVQAIEPPAQETVRPCRVDLAHSSHRRDHDRAEASRQPGIRIGDLEDRRVRELDPGRASKARHVGNLVRTGDERVVEVHRGLNVRRYPQPGLVGTSHDLG